MGVSSELIFFQLLETLKYWDTELFLFLNSFHNSVFDFLMYWISNRPIWIPLYIFFVYLVIKKYGKKSVIIFLFVAVLITLSDQLSVFFKNYFERPRPCHEENLMGLLHIVKDKCGGPYGFISSHASNSFSLTVFLISIFRGTYKFFTPLIIFWALIISCSRIYLGVHYPGDVICGALFGIFLGFLISAICLFVIRKLRACSEISPGI